MRTQLWQDWVVLILGLWLAVSAFAFSASAPFWSLFITGLAVVALAALAVIGYRWTHALVGVSALWLIVAPFVLGIVSLAATFEHVLLGILLAVFAIWRLIRGMRTTGFHSDPTADEHKAMSPD